MRVGGALPRARGECGILLDGDLAHEGEDARIAQFFRRVAVVVDIAVEHGPRRDVGQAVIRRVPCVRRPFLRLAPGLLEAAAGGCDFDRRDAIEIADIFGDRDAGHDRGLGVDHGRIGLHAALVDPKRDAAPAEGADIHVGRPRNQLEEAPSPFEDRAPDR